MPVKVIAIPSWGLALLPTVCLVYVHLPNRHLCRVPSPEIHRCILGFHCDDPYWPFVRFH